LHFNRGLTTEYSETTAHCNGNFDTDNQMYVPWPKCTATFRTHCIKLGISQLGSGAWNELMLGQVDGFCEFRNETSDSINLCKFLDQVRNYQLLNKESAAWSLTPLRILPTELSQISIMLT
jgi:hypothetical protein